MAKVRTSSDVRPKMRPALTPEARENQMIALAVDIAEEQMLNRTVSAQVLTHYLRLGTTKAQLEMKKIEQEIELQKAKTKAIDNMEESRVLYENAIKAMKEYAGYGSSDDED